MRNILDGIPTSEKGDHAELWRKLASYLQCRATGAVSISKIKGHATDQEVEEGKVKCIDKLGNHGADELAVTGAAMHAVLESYLQSARLRGRWARKLHRLMVDIAKARNAGKLPLQEQDGADFLMTSRL